jgi:glutathione peroxidase
VATEAATASSLYDSALVTLEGEPTTLGAYRGQVLLIVNVASKCGFTPQYRGLEALQRQFHSRGFTVLGFPCNQFGAQEPGTSEQIRSFCRQTYEVSFPLFAKTDVNGEHAHPLFRQLKARAKGLLGTTAIKWNFTKFLVSADATSIERFAPNTSPEKLVDRIEELLRSAG